MAIDTASGKPLWRHELDSLCLGAATIVNDLVFTSTYNGKIYAYSRKTGEQIWMLFKPVGDQLRVLANPNRNDNGITGNRRPAVDSARCLSHPIDSIKQI